ncbi:hypothetical protein IWZ01DRAFT_117458 [Phyllosticta capitalensis]
MDGHREHCISCRMRPPCRACFPHRNASHEVMVQAGGKDARCGYHVSSAPAQKPAQTGRLKTGLVLVFRPAVAIGGGIDGDGVERESTPQRLGQTTSQVELASGPSAPPGSSGGNLLGPSRVGAVRRLTTDRFAWPGVTPWVASCGAEVEFWNFSKLRPARLGFHSFGSGACTATPHHHVASDDTSALPIRQSLVSCHTKSQQFSECLPRPTYSRPPAPTLHYPSTFAQ